MSSLCYGDGVAAYVAARCGGLMLCPPFTTIGIEEHGRIVAGVVFNGFSARDIHVTVAGETGKFTREMLRAVGQYVFEQLGCLRISITTEQDVVIRIARRLGAEFDGSKPDYFGEGRPATLLGITKANWKFR